MKIDSVDRQGAGVWLLGLILGLFSWLPDLTNVTQFLFAFSGFISIMVNLYLASKKLAEQKKEEKNENDK